MTHRPQKVAPEPTIRSVPAFMLRGFWDELLKRGVTPGELERASGVARPRPGDFHASAPVHAVHRMFEAAMELTGDPTIGLSVGRELNTASFHLVGHLALASATLHQAVELGTRALPALAKRPPTLCELPDGNLRFGIVDERPCTTVGARVEAQLTAVLLHDLLPYFLQGNLCAVTVEFPFVEPLSLQPYRQFFAGPLRFGAKGTFVLFPQHALNRRRSGTDRDLIAHLLQIAQDRYGGGEAHAAWASRVRRALRMHVAPRLVDASALAEELGVSSRGLSRRLAREGVSLSALLDEALYERAKELLCRPGTTATAVSEALGYAELSSFFRAFRRWSGGRTPNEVRKQLASPSA